jgi:hypothetical protein
MGDSDELPEWKILEFEATIRRLASEGRLPTFEQFKAVMEKVRQDAKPLLKAISRRTRRHARRAGRHLA